MIQQVAGAELGAERALVAGGPGDPPDRLRASGIPPDEAVIPGKNDQAGRRLGHGLRKIAGQPSHHDPADEDAEVGTDGAPGGREDIGERSADGDLERLRSGDQPGHGQEFAGDRAVEPDIDQRFHVENDGADVLGQAARTDDPPHDFIDQHELIARGIDIVEGLDRDFRRAASGEAGDEIPVLFLDPDDPAAGRDALHGRGQPGEEFIGAVGQQLLVFMDEGLAFGGVDDERIDGRGEFDRGGEPGAPAADNAVIEDDVYHV